MNNKIGFLCLVFLSISHNTYSYEIGPSLAGFSPVHQALTKNSLMCLEKGNGDKPKECILKIKQCIDQKLGNAVDHRKSCFQKNRPSILFLDKFSVDDLEKAVKWPDDPTYEAFGTGVAKFGAKMLRGCEEFLNDRKGLDNTSGLLCNTHFGSYQFWHAQASELNEPSSETRQKILDWAKFNYEVAIGKIKPDDDYCSYFLENESSISIHMKPENYPFCEERLYWGWLPKWIAKPYPAWDIATLYGVSCENPFTSAFACEEELINNPIKREANTVVSATGALLHLIQDSFSQSHNERGKCYNAAPLEDKRPTPVSKIVCKPISLFTNYGQYNSEQNKIESQVEHKLSDDWPNIDDSCIDEKTRTHVDDPITASAKILWHIENKSDWNIDVLPDIEKVFNIVSKDFPSGPGICFTL